MENIRQKILLLLCGLMPLWVYAQEDCKDGINYSISNVTVNGAGTGYIINEDQSIHITIGQPYVGPSGSFNQGISERAGFWGFYELEPQGPYATASQGEFLDRIEVEWVVVDDRKGPPVTDDITKIFRNGKLLTSVPIQQTTYVDFNVFPGEFYTYEIVTTNSLGDAWPLETVGFLNPNGRVTGKVETRTGAPVADVKVVLTPNLGRSLDLDGNNDYVYFLDQAYEFGEYYTIEGWWRNVDVQNQTIFAAIDSGTTTPLIKVSLDDEGKIHYYHDGDADGTGLELVSKDGYNLDAFSREWHHFAAVYDTTKVYLYVDGQRVGEDDVTESISEIAEIELGKDGPKQYTGYYSGFLDDFRIWRVGRTREQIRRFKDITLTGEEEHLQTYWKFDEQFGNKIFDFTEKPVEDRDHGFLCDVTRSDFISPAELGAYTDEGGDYIIKGVFYGTGQTFAATPSKETPIGFSLDFDGTDDFVSYQLDRINYDNAFTLEGWFKTGVDGQDMVIYETTNSASDETLIQVGIQSTGELFVSVGFGGTLNTITTADPVNDEFWYHYAIVHDGSNATLYLDGNEVGSVADGSISDVSSRLVIGRSDPIEFNAGSNYFQGSLDEMRLWNYARTENQVNSTLNQIIPGDEQGIVDPDGSLGLTAYWMMGEGRGAIISDVTPNGHTGELLNFQEILIEDETLVANWNGDDLPLNVEFFEHDFDPNARNVSLDPSNTAVDRVDFTDISQLGMSGFVKFSDTDCFAEGIEMKINGASIVPPVFTDEDGKFVVELEPGTTSAFLSAASADYAFDPIFIELPRAVRPLAGLKFDITTKRTVNGIVAGGECLLPTGTSNVRFASIDGCFESIVAVDDQTGEFTAENIPPLQYEVSVVDHEDTQIQSFFDTQGALTIDIRQETDSISFIYVSTTQARMTFPDSEPNDCDIQVNGETGTILKQGEEYQAMFELYQVYGLDTCILNQGVAYIDDFISDFSPKDTVDIIDGKAIYNFKAGVPNLATPHTKSMTIVGEDVNGAQATGFENVVVLGFKTLTSTFETTTPQLPLLILRDPPGDASFSFMEENKQVCSSVGFSYTEDVTTDANVAVHLGPDISFETGLFISKETSIDATNDLSIGVSATSSFGSEVEYESCLTSAEIFRTSDDELTTGGRGDVYVGGAFNILVGTNRVLDINSETCALEQEDVLMILPTGFATTYIYTDEFIEKSIIPDLEELGDTESADQWRTIRAYNQTLKDNAVFQENISFTSGIELERSTTYEQTSTQSMSLSSSFATEISREIGLTVDGIGFSAGISFASSSESEYTRTSTQSTSKTVGFNLNDEDFGDNFTLDLKTDAAGMPVFDLIAGESLCPWEDGTKTRTAVDVTALTPTNVVDVPEDEPAVFRFSLANVAETAEDQFYEFRVIQESNPDGAVIKVNGVIVEKSLSIFVRANQNEEVTVTVERGPEEYVYTDLQWEFYVPCELEKAEILGLDVEALIAEGSPFFARQSASVEFVKTCQKPNIFSPDQDWLINNTSNNQIAVTLSEVDLDQAEFDRLKFQYRKQVEGEPFINGETIERADITGNSHSFTWDVSAVDDDIYELRAISECNSGFLPGISELVSGRIDRQPPEVLGTPAPVDAVLGLDDEVTISFEEDVNCDEIISLAIPVSLEQGSLNNIDLSNTETGLSIAKDVSCVNNQLVITPDIQNKFIEGQVLRVDVLGLEDLYGNIQTQQTTWEFLVNRNPLEWVGGDIQDIIQEGQGVSFTRQIRNNGAFDVNVNLSGALDVQTLEETLLPSWITATPRAFSIQPGGTQDIEFTISDQLGGGEYIDVVTAATSFGAPELRFDIRVLCPEPEWEIDPSQFENSINFVGQLDIRGDLSVDEFDIVAAFVGDELRGVGNVTFTPELQNIPGEHPYLIFLTIYTNSTSEEVIDFRVWDASVCQLYGQVAEQYTISLQSPAIGTPTDPMSITVTNNVIQNIPLSAGWNWISLNLNSNSNRTRDVFGTLRNSRRGDVIKSQTEFSQYLPGLGWVGPLQRLDTTQAFRVRLNESDTLRVVGEPIDFETTMVELDSGWNWISFLPQVSMEINQALSNINATADFLIKSQTDFAQYVEFVGWIGSLDFLRPNEGYLLLTNSPLTLEYPVTNQNGRQGDDERVPDPLPPGWLIDVGDFENNANIIAKVNHAGLKNGDFIGLFQGETLHGYGQARYIEALNEYYFFITAYMNGEPMDFDVRYFGSGQFVDVDEVLTVRPESLMGSIEAPIVFNLEGTVLGIDEIQESIKIYPNPFTSQTTIALNVTEQKSSKITIHNLAGQEIGVLYDGILQGGKHEFVIDEESLNRKPTSGLYVVVINLGGEVNMRKIVRK